MTEPASESHSASIRTPERLDRALTVTTPKTWIMLAALIAGLAIVVAWSILGEVAT